MTPTGLSPGFLAQAFHALRSRRWHRLTGRFVFMRKWVAHWRAWRDQAMPVPETRDENVIDGLVPEQCLAGLRRDGLWSGLRLPPSLVAEIAAFARQRACRNGQDGPELFRFEELQQGRSPQGSPVAIAEVEACQECSAVQMVASDPLLFQTATQYLGFRPRKILRRLYWSPCADLPDKQRRAGGQTIDFHYDIEPSSSLYVFFYIEGGERDSGAHVAIAGSHRNKPLRLALAPAFQSDTRIFTHYARDRERVLEGEPGFGFLEDPGCYHKALPPRSAHRLVLQLRLS